MPRKPRPGKDCHLYYGTAWATPVWTEIGQAVDVSMPGIQKNKTPVRARDAGGWEAQLAGLKKMTLEFGYLYEADAGNDDADAVFAALRDSFLNDTVLVFAVMDGPVDVSGVTAQGFRFPGIVFDFPTSEELEDTKSFDIGVELTRWKETTTLILPEWYTVTTA